MSTLRWALPPRREATLRWALALSGWVAVAAVATLPDAAILRVLVVTLFLVVCPGLAAARWAQPSPFRQAGRALVLETAVLAVVLSTALGVLVVVPFYLGEAYTTIRALTTLAALTSALALLPRPGVRRHRRTPADGGSPKATGQLSSPSPGAAAAPGSEHTSRSTQPPPHRGPATASPPSRARRSQVVVLGAGPYGLATAAHLDAAGMRPRIFGEPMEAWHAHMPDGMRLRTDQAASSISAPEPGHELADFRAAQGLLPADHRRPIPVHEFIDYGQWFQERRVPQVERSRVLRTQAVDGGFGITLDSGEELLAATLVVATGAVPFAHLPTEWLHCTERGLASHASDHGDLSRFAGQRVAVVGAGDSAVESAALLHEAGARPTLIARRTVGFAPPQGADGDGGHRRAAQLLRPDSPLGPGWASLACTRVDAYRRLPPSLRRRLLRRVPGPSGAWWLTARTDGTFPVLTRRTVRAVVPEGEAVRLELTKPHRGSGALVVDHVLLATGYRVNVRRLEFLDPGLRQAIRTFSGAPWLSTGFESSVPGLHFTGLAAAPTYGPVLGFVAGTGFAARRVTATIAARNRR